MMLKEIHSFKNFSISISSAGEYFAEHDDGRDILLLSPSGSDEHQHEANWIENKTRTETDFLAAYPEIAQ